MLGESQFDPNEIQKHLDQTVQFSGPAKPAAWQIVWHFDSHSTMEVERAAIEIEEQIAGHEYTKVGEILHVFGLKLAMSRFGLTAATRDEVVDAAKRYIDELRAAGRLPAVRKGRIPFDSNTGSAGLGYFENETPEFKDVLLYLREAQSAAEVATYGDRAAELLKQLSEEPNVFADRISYRKDGENDETILQSPVLASIPVDDFVSALLSIAPSDQRNILTGLFLRHEPGSNADLAEERDWIKRVYEKIDHHARNAEPWERTRLDRALGWSLRQLLTNWAKTDERGSETIEQADASKRDINM